MFIELEKDNLAEILQENPNVFVQFSAGWCGNCKIMKPKFKRFSEEDAHATFVLVDAENFPESRKLAKVDNLPKFAKFVNGELKLTKLLNSDLRVLNNLDYYLGIYGSGRENIPTWYPFLGKIDDVAIYNRALTIDEISKLYKGEKF